MLTVETAKDPVYTNADGTGINLQVKFAEFNDFIPFHAIPTDTMEYGVQLYDDAKAGKYGDVAPYVAPPPKEQPKTAGTQTV